ncbi:MAG TPA: phosphoribosylanthranilate isomerase [Candidatus Binatia bacterium]|jgi:phosphoribosylanthranilate isomerase|nr:phosphoribosylanthranilate isomerase [Candidatus Binatia bacterium]
MTVKVKVCGITNLADAEKALEYGADMLGFNFYPPSSRSIAPEKAREILQALPAGSFNVALFVNAAKEKVQEIIAHGQLPGGRQAYNGLQFHGEENATFCRGWGMKVIKAFRVKEKNSLAGMKDFPADFYLLDSWSTGYGGSGEQFPWDWLDGIDTNKLILSGGLRVDNVADAIHRIHPFGVDVCSGVEARPGIKDHVRLKEFILAAKGA